MRRRRPGAARRALGARGRRRRAATALRSSSEHAIVSTEVEWEGRTLDVISGVWSGSELPLSWALPRYQGARPADRPAAEWHEPTPERAEQAERSVRARAALL